ncbi:GntR family transcriptional repressor for pyruvate dehydrogenase complex [Nocardioides zeae]|uniref:GntR family transcriptional repressor for pyruvate dehydrogenase complex n=1 Tax=Nocardioides zeae TaxID=1457234 RepID=A0ACC6IJ79_9ACTN|nr:GntR family transcriptional regulator [Nocardioides zeae]MDR6174659.1 GntR family transcriptional repressor for pyruvate dehydrogenase complex [Nocardioides zeae]MDR6210728.1 GntR family transcriptional repressor for pyruvate dehydrogenase complex [Nocardioides zeae]
MSEDVDQVRTGLPIVYRPGDPLAGDGVDSPGGRPPKASEATAERIVHGIVSNGYAVGDRMPAESEMLERTGVSRETLREALRILEAQGILTIRRGPGGGPFVNALNASYLARTSALYFHLAGATYEELFETWAFMEPLISAKVASLPDRRSKLDRLSPFMAYDPHAHTRGQVIHELNDFHAVLATMSGNRVLTLLTQAVDHIVVHQVLTRADPTDKSKAMAHSHDDIARAIVDGYATKARKLMEEHIRDVVAWVSDINPGMLGELIEWR